MKPKYKYFDCCCRAKITTIGGNYPSINIRFQVKKRFLLIPYWSDFDFFYDQQIKTDGNLSEVLSNVYLSYLKREMSIENAKRNINSAIK